MQARSMSLFALLLGIALVTAGCVSTAPTAPDESPTPTVTPTEPTTTATDTLTPTPTATVEPPAATVEFPDGPKERPDRPAQLTRSSVREYAEQFEYRFVYNSLWVNEYTEVGLECSVRDVTERSWGYEATVMCTGSSNTDPPSNSTAKGPVHYDWFTQTYRYLVSANATERRDAPTATPTS